MRRVVSVALLVVCCVVLAACAAFTDDASNVSATSAQLNAHGHTDGTPAHYEFQYAPDASLLGTPDQFTTGLRGPIPARVPGNGSDVVFGEQVKALRPGTTYSYRVCGGDGQIHPDVCAATRSFSTPAGAPAVDFATSNPFYDLPGIAGSVVVADFNRDGNPDLGVVGGSFFSGRPPGPVLIFLGDGKGGFASPSSVGPPGVSSVNWVAAGSFTNNGKVDLAVGYGNNAGVLLMGDGNGGFTPGTPFSVDGGVSQLVARDVNHDGKLDLAVVSPNGGSHIVVLLGNGTGGFTASGDIDSAEQPGRLALRDMNHDGNPDLVVTTNTPLGVSVLLGDGKGGFGAPHHASLSSDSSDIVVADIDRDGNPDVVVPGWLLPGDGQGNVGAARSIPNSPTSALAVADFNNDGRADLAGEVDHGFSFSSDKPLPTRIRVLLGNGDTTFQTPNDFPCSQTQLCRYPQTTFTQSVAADLFHDGKPSLVTAGSFHTGSSGVGIVSVQRNTTP